MLKCQQCSNFFAPEIERDADGNCYEVNTKLCYQCFEGALEDYESSKRERIARDNEY